MCLKSVWPTPYIFNGFVYQYITVYISYYNIVCGFMEI